MSGWEALGRNLAVTALLLAVLLVAAFGYARARSRYRTVDVVWGFAFALVAVTGLVLSAGHGTSGRRILITVLTVLWGVRLAVHIGLRSRGEPEDPRYEAMLSRAPGSRAWFAFKRVYVLQGALIWFISLPVQVAQYGTKTFGAAAAGAAVALGCGLWLTGMWFEGVGDWQLARFKADPANRGRLLTTGLRRYTRHPNYFGDACVWWGLFAIAASTRAGVLTVLSPLLMTWLLARGSGTPLLDAHLAATRPEFESYAARTSGFLPRRPRQRSDGR